MKNASDEIAALADTGEIAAGAETIGLSPQAHPMVSNPNEVLSNSRAFLTGYLDFWRTIGWLNPLVLSLVGNFEKTIKNTTELSTRSVAKKMRNISHAMWQYNNQDPDFSIPIQKGCNNCLLTHAEDGTLNVIKSDQLTPLFKAGEEKDWPHLILTSNHARASEVKDLYELMDGICALAKDVWGKALNLCRLTTETSTKDAKAKNIVILACHTEKDNLLNGANLIDRRLDLEEDTNKENPANRTLNHLSPAAARLAKLILKLMVEPESQNLIDLKRSNADVNNPLHARPFISDDLQDKEQANAAIVIRNDAKKIAGHIKLIGYSKGANTVTDALRFFYQECKHLNNSLKIRDSENNVRPIVDKDIKGIIASIALLNIASGEVPLTDVEKEKLGIRRTTILNTHDFTAGHLVNPNLDRYHNKYDRLIKIAGDKEEAGHSVESSLGKKNLIGFIANLENAVAHGTLTKEQQDNVKNYRLAQEAVRDFFLSNHCAKDLPRMQITGQVQSSRLAPARHVIDVRSSP